MSLPAAQAFFELIEQMDSSLVEGNQYRLDFMYSRYASVATMAVIANARSVLCMVV